jgi:hypothetical protein
MVKHATLRHSSRRHQQPVLVAAARLSQPGSVQVELCFRPLPLCGTVPFTG